MIVVPPVDAMGLVVAPYSERMTILDQDAHRPAEDLSVLVSAVRAQPVNRLRRALMRLLSLDF